MQTRTRGIVLLVAMLGLLGAGSGGFSPSLVRADTDPGCAVVEAGSGNTAAGFCATVSGGLSNSASADRSVVSGGSTNTASGGNATVGGGGGNVASGLVATVAGGESNSASGVRATVGGGYTNRVTDDHGTVGGGRNNQAGNNAGTTADQPYATAHGGIDNTASSWGAMVGGGAGNTASGWGATVGGGSSNHASGILAAIPGGYANAASGYFSLAAGRQAQAAHAGSFVWGDSQDLSVKSTGSNQFVVRAGGGIWLGTTSTVPAPDATKFLNTSTGAYLSSGGTWTNSSDRNLKANIAAVNSQEILEKVAALPVQTWNYTSQDASVKHIGPMAQDFAAAFGVGEDDRHISTVDADGVALAAIQGLHQENQELKARLLAIESAQRGGVAVQAAPSGVMLSWGTVALGGIVLLALLILSTVRLTLLFLRRRTPPV